MSDTSTTTGEPRLGPRFSDALIYAAQLHAHQVRKGTPGTPYLAHLMAVASLVLEDDGSEDEAIGALLHDAIEDQPRGGVTGPDIRRRFGDRVYEIVHGCTDAHEHPKPPWRERKEAYLKHIPGQLEHVRRVSIADKVHNARSVLADLRKHGDGVWERFKGGKEGTLWYYRALADAYLGTGGGFLAKELDRTVREIERETRSVVGKP